jgi:hypothetical protein
MSFLEYAASPRRILANVMQSGLAVGADLEGRPKKEIVALLPEP